ncbi:MAG TPA: hypothetical protein VKR31_03985 [Rhizomicrobium sp.]|nr:hypothetical protein [Rhizomicrobium sp.]
MTPKTNLLRVEAGQHICLFTYANHIEVREVVRVTENRVYYKGKGWNEERERFASRDKVVFVGPEAACKWLCEEYERISNEEAKDYTALRVKYAMRRNAAADDARAHEGIGT